jgi:hypothetical protein
MASYVCEPGATALLDFEFGRATPAVPRSFLYFGLSTQPANKTGAIVNVTGLGGGIGGGGYYPAIVANNPTNFPATSGGVKTNGVAIQWPQAPTTDWGFNINGVITPMPVVSVFLYNLGNPLVQAITTTLAGDTHLTFAAAARTNAILPGMTLTLAGSIGETVKVPLTWIPGSSAVVPLTSAVVHAGQTTAQSDTFTFNQWRYWDITPVSISNGAAAPSIAAGALTFSHT